VSTVNNLPKKDVLLGRVVYRGRPLYGMVVMGTPEIGPKAIKNLSGF